MSEKIDPQIDRELIDNPADRELKRWQIEQARRRSNFTFENLAGLKQTSRPRLWHAAHLVPNYIEIKTDDI